MMQIVKVGSVQVTENMPRVKILFNNYVKSHQQSGQIRRKEFRLFDIVIRRINGEIPAVGKINACKICILKNGICKITIIQLAFGQIRLRKIRAVNPAIIKNRFIQLFLLKNGIIQNAAFKFGSKSKILAF